jgi:hypothetical protein
VRRCTFSLGSSLGFYPNSTERAEFDELKACFEREKFFIAQAREIRGSTVASICAGDDEGS